MAVCDLKLKVWVLHRDNEQVHRDNEQVHWDNEQVHQDNEQVHLAKVWTQTCLRCCGTFNMLKPSYVGTCYVPCLHIVSVSGERGSPAAETSCGASGDQRRLHYIHPSLLSSAVSSGGGDSP